MSSSSDRSPPVYRGRNLCLAAPAVAGQGVDTPRNRNAAQWKSIAYFLAGIEVMARGAEGAPLAGKAPAPRAAINFGECPASATSIVPVGNTGTTYPRGEA